MRMRMRMRIANSCRQPVRLTVAAFKLGAARSITRRPHPSFPKASWTQPTARPVSRPHLARLAVVASSRAALEQLLGAEAQDGGQLVLTEQRPAPATASAAAAARRAVKHGAA
jgi:hypothetical protein